MNILKWALAAAAVSLVAACGGGCPGTPPFGTPASGATACGSSTSSSATSVDVLASSVQVGSGGETVTITAVVKGAGNVGLSGATVGFSASTGTLTGVMAMTDANGTATATFSAGADRSNRNATVTVTSGSASGSIQLAIVGTLLSYSGVTTIPLQGTSTVGVKAVDSRGAVISGLTVAVSSSLNNGLSASTITTNSQGTATVDYTATAAGSDTLTFAGAGTSVAPTILVSAADFTFISPSAGTQITVGTPQLLTVRYLNNNVPQSGVQINFSATAGVVAPATATTDAAGQATVAISSITASAAVIQATVSGAVQATLPVMFVADTPATLVLHVQPTAIGPNPAGATAEQAQLNASVTDVNGNPVSGVTVAFNLIADPSHGTLSQPSANTDSSGLATVQYIAGPQTTPSDGVQVNASVLGNPAVFGGATLTVNSSALYITLNTGNTISNFNEQTYSKDWDVSVTDASGHPVPNVRLTMSVLPLRYRKGNLVFQGGGWVYDPTPGHFFDCANEDTDYSGIYTVGKDFNGDGQLQPGNVVLVTTTSGTPGIAISDANGHATVTLLYGENYWPWVRVGLKAQAVVTGTESSREADFWVPALASDTSQASNPPAGVVSPFGVNDCATPN